MAKGAYIGVATELPIYSEQTTSASINGSNIGTFFTVSHGSYGFYDSGNTGAFTTNNAAVHSGVAQTTLTALSDMKISFSYSYSSEPNYDKFTLTVAGITVENAVSGATTTKNYSGSVAKGQQIVFKYAKDGSVNKNDDKCTFSNMKVTATVKTQIGSETRNIAHKVKKGYIGVNSVARKIKKAYIGIGGIARPCWAGGEKLVYYGAITPLSVDRTNPTTGTINNYTLFAGGGWEYSNAVKTVDVYDNTLIKTTAPDLNGKKWNMGSASTGDYILFVGGQETSVVGTSQVEAYNSSLVKTTLQSLSKSTYDFGSTTIGEYALFAGGFHYGLGGNDSSKRYDTVLVYNANLTQTILSTKLPSTASELGATTLDPYALFLYGSWVAAYDKHLTQTIIEQSSSFGDCRALTVGQYAIFARCTNYNTATKKVVAFDVSLTKTICTDLTYSTTNSGTTLQDYGMFYVYNADNKVSAMDIYDASLTKTTTIFTDYKTSTAAATAGNYALFLVANEMVVYTVI